MKTGAPRSPCQERLRDRGPRLHEGLLMARFQSPSVQDHEPGTTHGVTLLVTVKPDGSHQFGIVSLVYVVCISMARLRAESAFRAQHGRVRALRDRRTAATASPARRRSRRPRRYRCGRQCLLPPRLLSLRSQEGPPDEPSNASTTGVHQHALSRRRCRPNELRVRHNAP